MSPLGRLQLFAYEAEKLRREPLVVEGGWHNQFHLRYDTKTQVLTTRIEQPDELKLRSLMLQLRRFVADNDPVFLNRIYNICEQNIVDATLKEHLRNARTHWKHAQQSGGINWTYDGVQLSPVEVADLWINAEYFHSDVAKKRKLDQIHSGGKQSKGLSRVMLVGFIGDAAQHVLYIDNIVRHALRDGLIRNAA